MGKIKKYKIIIIILSVLFLSGCVAQNNSVLDNNVLNNSSANIIDLQVHKSKASTVKVKKIEGLEHEEGYGTGIYTTQGECLHDMTNYKKSTEDLSLYYHISNDLGNTHTFTIVILDNYHQIPFVVNDEECLNYTVEIPNFEETDIPIDLGKLTSGRHDIVFLTFINAGTTEIGFDPIVHGFMDSAHRSTFIVDDDNELYNPITYHANAEDNEYLGVNLKKVDKDSYELSVAGVYDDDKCVSVIVFDNYEEIGKYTLELGAMNSVSIPFNYSADNNIKHELAAVLLYKTDGDDSEEPIDSLFSTRIQF